MRIGIIGCGVMGGAFAAFLAREHELLLYDHREENSEALAKQTGGRKVSLDELAKGAEMVILAVKPQTLKKVSEATRGLFSRGQILVSILSGKSLQTLKESFPGVTVFRTMPNLPLLVGKGVIGIVKEEGALVSTRKKLDGVLSSLGTVTWLDEEQMDGFTALTGSNPAFIYYIFEAMLQGASEFGFEEEMASELLLNTFAGALSLLRKTRRPPKDLREKICSPGGTTLAGLSALQEGQVGKWVVEALHRTAKRSQELGGDQKYTS